MHYTAGISIKEVEPAVSFRILDDEEEKERDEVVWWGSKARHVICWIFLARS